MSQDRSPHYAHAIVTSTSAAATKRLLVDAQLAVDDAHPEAQIVVRQFAQGRSYRQIRVGAARAYGQGQGKSWKRVISAFTNPGDRRWQKRYLRR